MLRADHVFNAHSNSASKDLLGNGSSAGKLSGDYVTDLSADQIHGEIFPFQASGFCALPSAVVIALDGTFSEIHEPVVEHAYSVTGKKFADRDDRNSVSHFAAVKKRTVSGSGINDDIIFFKRDPMIFQTSEFYIRIFCLSLGDKFFSALFAGYLQQ